MAHERRQPLRNWWTAGHLVVAGLLLGLTVFGLAALFLLYVSSETRSRELDRAELMARVLARQANATLALDAANLEALSRDMIELASAREYSEMSLALSRMLDNRPDLRSVSLVDAQGRVLASSSPDNLGTVLPAATLPSLSAPAGKYMLAPLMSGRDLRTMEPPSPGRPMLPVMPVLQPIGEVNAQPLYLVLLVNLDYLVNQFEATLVETDSRVALAGFDGTLLSATSNLATEPGSTLRGIDVFSRFLPARESGRYVGAGISGDRVLTAFAPLRHWPLLVIVEVPYARVTGPVTESALFAATVVALLLGATAAVTVPAARSLRRRQGLLDSVNEASRALRASDQRNEAVLRSALDGIVTIDRHGNVVAFNPAAEHIFGHFGEAALGRPMAELIVPPAMRSAHHAGFARHLRTGESRVLNQRLEVPALHADGHEFPIELTIAKLDIDGEAFFTATVRDITQQKRIAGELEGQKIALQASEERFRATFEQAGVGLLHQARDRRFLMVNDVMCRMLGYTREEFLALNADQLVHPEDRDPGIAMISPLFAGDLVSNCVDKRFRSKVGAYMWVRLTTSLARDAAGQPLYMICVVEDIDDYRLTQNELAAARTRELEIGARIQQGLLVAQRPPEIGGLWVSTYSQASGGIDGDFVDVIRISEHIVDVLSGDAMGKGVPAALLGAATKLQFSRSLAELLSRREQGEGPPEPSAVVAAVNLEMAPHLLALEAFVTLVYLRIDTLANTLTWVGCGHEETLLVPAAGAYSVLANQQPPIGIFLNAAFEQDRRTLGPGDVVFLCSDGVTEAIDVSGERMGSEPVRQRAAHRIRRHGSPAMALHALRQDGARARVVDDLTMVMLMRSELHGQVHRIELALNLDSIQQLRDFVTQNTQLRGLSEERIANFTVAAVEVFTNIWRHGQGLLVGAPVEAFIEQRDTGVELELRHVGGPFVPPTEVPETDLASLPEGGFGLYIIQNACDDVNYRHQEGVNTVRLTLQVRAPVQPG